GRDEDDLVQFVPIQRVDAGPKPSVVDFTGSIRVCLRNWVTDQSRQEDHVRHARQSTFQSAGIRHVSKLELVAVLLDETQHRGAVTIYKAVRVAHSRATLQQIGRHRPSDIARPAYQQNTPAMRASVNGLEPSPLNVERTSGGSRQRSIFGIINKHRELLTQAM